MFKAAVNQFQKVARLSVLAQAKFSLLLILALCITLLSLPTKLAATPFHPGNWQPVPSHREDRGNIKVVWLQGSPYRPIRKLSPALLARLS